MSGEDTAAPPPFLALLAGLTVIGNPRIILRWSRSVMAVMPLCTRGRSRAMRVGFRFRAQVTPARARTSLSFRCTTWTRRIRSGVHLARDSLVDRLWEANGQGAPKATAQRLEPSNSRASASASSSAATLSKRWTLRLVLTSLCHWRRTESPGTDSISASPEPGPPSLIGLLIASVVGAPLDLRGQESVHAGDERDTLLG